MLKKFSKYFGRKFVCALEKFEDTEGKSYKICETRNFETIWRNLEMKIISEGFWNVSEK